ncbi:MAG TPA: hypothetical protein VFM18_24500 [Methanosarcina sp.]|nr:hypothetical protein [Methanosarcina sp.]
MNGKKAKEIRRVCAKEFKHATDKQYREFKHAGVNRYNRSAQPQIFLTVECGRHVYQNMKKLYLAGTPIA